MKSAITTERWLEDTQSSTKITKDATGTAVMAPTTGATSSRTTRARLESAARRTPSAAPATYPTPIRASERPIEAQNSPVAASPPRRASTSSGPTRTMRASTARAASSQTASQKAAAARRAPHVRTWGAGPVRFFSPGCTTRYAP